MIHKFESDMRAVQPRYESSQSTFGRLLRRLRGRVAHGLLAALYGQPMYVSSIDKGGIAACAVFWYVEGGTRRFIMVKQGEKAKARFVSCLGLQGKANGMAALLSAIKTQLGDGFYRSFDSQLIEAERITAAPAFDFEDETTDRRGALHTLVWAVQVTPEQAQLCEPDVCGVEVLSVPEFGVIGPDVAGAHHHIYKSVLRHIHAERPGGQDVLLEQLDEILPGRGALPKTIH